MTKLLLNAVRPDVCTYLPRCYHASCVLLPLLLLSVHASTHMRTDSAVTCTTSSLLPLQIVSDYLHCTNMQMQLCMQHHELCAYASGMAELSAALRVMLAIL